MAVISEQDQREGDGVARSLLSPVEVDAAIVATVRKFGARTGGQLLAMVDARPRLVVDRLLALVSAEVLRHDGRRFTLRGRS